MVEEYNQKVGVDPDVRHAIGVRGSWEINNVIQAMRGRGYSDEDIKKLTSSPSQVLAIFEKDIDSELYSTVKHVAKGLNLHHLILPPEISSKISLEHYVYRGK